MSYYYREQQKGWAPGTSKILNYTLTRSKDRPEKLFEAHNHDVFELNAVTRGALRIRIDGEGYELSEGDIIIANPYELHEGTAIRDTECEYITLTCALSQLLYSNFGGMSDTIGDLLSSRCGFHTVIRAEQEHAEALMQCIRRGYEATQRGGDVGRCEALAETFRLFTILFAHDYRALPPRGGKNNKDFFRQVTAYLEENYRNRISTADIAAALYMSESRFCHSFRRYYNDSFSRVLCRYRVMKATHAADSETANLSELAASVGFTSYQYFARAFSRELGCSPSQYFKNGR